MFILSWHPTWTSITSPSAVKLCGQTAMQYHELLLRSLWFSLQHSHSLDSVQTATASIGQCQ